jgi:hypothetical protein
MYDISGELNVILIAIWWLQAAQKFDVKRFNLKKLSDLQVRKPYQIEILNRFATLENINASVDKNGVWENIKGYFKTSGNDSLSV